MHTIRHQCRCLTTLQMCKWPIPDDIYRSLQHKGWKILKWAPLNFNSLIQNSCWLTYWLHPSYHCLALHIYLLWTVHASQTTSQPQATLSFPQRDRQPLSTPRTVSPSPDSPWRLSVGPAIENIPKPPSKNNAAVIESSDAESDAPEVVNPKLAKVKRKQQKETSTSTEKPAAVSTFPTSISILCLIFTLLHCSLNTLNANYYVLLKTFSKQVTKVVLRVNLDNENNQVCKCRHIDIEQQDKADTLLDY